jgi:DNA-binding NarL/FixJ family response regulator
MLESIMEDPVKVIIADSHEIVREGIALRLETDCAAQVVGQAADGYTTIKVCRNLQPDILLMDIALTRPSGAETFRKLRQILPNLKIIVVSSDEDIADAFVMMGQGASAFMTKRAKGSHFVNTIRSVALGYSVVPSDYLADFIGMKDKVSKSGNVYGLSPREIEVLQACATGASTKEVAERLEISVRTVETHRNAIYRKTSCGGLSELSGIAAKLC